jgi:hypothetical protein
VPGGGYYCHGFDVVERDMRQMAATLGKPWDPAWDTPSVETYEHYRALTQTYGASPHGQNTWWEPGTLVTVQRHLNRLRNDGRLARLWLGDPETGVPWVEEYDTVGRIGRTGGWLKSMILVAPGQDGGGIIFTSKVLRIDVWAPKTRRWTTEWQARNFAMPAMDIRHTPDDAERPWEVFVKGELHASFATLPKAAAWISWMSGEFYEPSLDDSEEEDADEED